MWRYSHHLVGKYQLCDIEKELRVLYTVRIWLPHKILIYHVQRSNCPVIANLLHQSKLFLLFTLIQIRIFYVLRNKSFKKVTYFDTLFAAFIHFWISALCLSISFKVRLKMVTYFFLRSDFRLYGFTRISYSLHSSL